MHIIVRHDYTYDLVPIVHSLGASYEKGIGERVSSEIASDRLASIGAVISNPIIGSVPESLRFENKQRTVRSTRSIEYNLFIGLDRTGQISEIGKTLVECIQKIPDSFMSVELKSGVISAINETCVDLGGIIQEPTISASRQPTDGGSGAPVGRESIPQFIVQYRIDAADVLGSILERFERLDFDNWIEYDGHDLGIGKLNLFFYTYELERARNLFIRRFQEGSISQPTAMGVNVDGEYSAVYPDEEDDFDIF